MSLKSNLIYKASHTKWIEYPFYLYQKHIQGMFLKNKDLSCFSNNCWYGIKCSEFGMRYNSPTVGMIIRPKDYLNFLLNPEQYLGQPIIDFGWDSEYDVLLGQIVPENPIYPPIRLDLVHYTSCEQATKDWLRRSPRVDFNNLLVKFSDRFLRSDEFSEMVSLFSDLNYKHKIFFTSRRNVKINNCKVIYCPEYVEDDSTRCWAFDKYHFNVVKLFNKVRSKSTF